MRFVALSKGKKVVGYAGPFRNGPQAERWAESAVKLGGGAVTGFDVLTVSDPDHMMAEVLRSKDAREIKQLPKPRAINSP